MFAQGRAPLTLAAPALALLLWGCNGGTGSTTETASNTTTPPATTTTATTTETTGAPADECTRSSDCEPEDPDVEEICIAPYVLDEGPGPGGMRGPAVCVPESECIAIPFDLNSWCFDHSGCCGTMRCKTVDGVCEPLDPNTTGETSETTDSSSTDGSTTDGTSTGGTTDGTTDGSTTDGSTTGSTTDTG